MGGYGSGRRSYGDGKETTEDLLTIDVRRWQREGFLVPGRFFNWQWTRNDKKTAEIYVRPFQDCVALTYRHRVRGREWKELSYGVDLARTNCHFGGRRPWFICPAEGCGKRTAILYCNGIFACRECHQLAYPSQRESHEERAERKAEKIRERLGWLPGFLNGEGIKPKGMHWETFYKLRDEHNQLVASSIRAAAARFNVDISEFTRWL